MAQEINFDGLVGPSHNYGGLSFGNIASAAHEGEASNPKQAALQGLKKMRALRDMGITQAVLPPHYRPELSLARRLGYEGSDESVLAEVAKSMPALLAACYSASAMWTANAATVSPSIDSDDGKVHFTPANLQNKAHRWIESPTTARVLKAIFQDEARFAHHEPLPSTAALSDEGAANHTRFAPRPGARGIQLFVYGEIAARPWEPRPKIFPARQTLEACLGLQRLHRVPDEQVVHAHQNPEAIDNGVFHNDVISVGHQNVFFYHEDAFVGTETVLEELRQKYEAVTEDTLRLVPVTANDVPVAMAVTTYLFNSQLVTRPDGQLVLIAPTECEEKDQVRDFVRNLVDGDAPIDDVRYFDLRQSMQGGGGPACLRLRVVLTDEERQSIAPDVFLTEALDARLVTWIEKHYRDRVTPKDLADPQLMEESRVALDELTSLLKIGSIYPFQS